MYVCVCVGRNVCVFYTAPSFLLVKIMHYSEITSFLFDISKIRWLSCGRVLKTIHLPLIPLFQSKGTKAIDTHPHAYGTASEFVMRAHVFLWPQCQEFLEVRLIIVDVNVDTSMNYYKAKTKRSSLNPKIAGRIIRRLKHENGLKQKDMFCWHNDDNEDLEGWGVWAMKVSAHFNCCPSDCSFPRQLVVAL